jgi:hypothetical protein
MDQMGSLTQTSINGADTSFSKPETTVLCYDTQQLPYTSTNTAESSQKRIEPYLNRAFLLILVLGFMVMIAALETLAWLSKRNQGLATANEDWHYLWTYGPTMSKHFRGRIIASAYVERSSCTSDCSLGSN